MNKILLVEPAYNNPYPPLGLMKISTWHKRKGDIVHFFKDIEHNDKIDKFIDYGESYKRFLDHYDIIYITSLFTYQAYFVIRSINYFKKKFPDSGWWKL